MKSSIKIVCRILLCLFLFPPLFLSAQVALPIKPYSNTHKLPEEVPIYEIPSYNNDSLNRVHNHSDVEYFTSQTIGVVLPADIDMERFGRWDRLEDGRNIWRLRIISPNSEGFRITCDQFSLPEGAALFFYDSTGIRQYGAYTHFNNKPHGKFSTGVLPGKNLIIEYNFQGNRMEKPQFHINKISYIFRSDHIGAADQGCDIDVNCVPWANEWCNEIRAVVKILYRFDNGEEVLDNWGSGVLINNTNNNYTPYILTARHIAIGTYDIGGSLESVEHENWTIYYNFQTPTCQINTGNDRMRTIGVEVVTANSADAGNCPDLGLLKSTDSIPLGYNIFFAGWNRNKRNDWPSDDLVTIHHAQGDLKKISQGLAVGTTAAGKCYEVKYDLGLGIIENASSGAPSFDENHRIVAIQSSVGLTCEEDGASVSQGNIGKAHEPGIDFDWYTYLGGGNILDGIDPLAACQDEIEIFGSLYPGKDWQKKNAILAQAASSIIVSPNNKATLIQQTPSYMTVSNLSDYTFRAGSSVKFMTGFKIEYGNRLLAEIGSCEENSGCGINFEPIPEKTSAIPSNLQTPAELTFSNMEDSVFIYPNPSTEEISIRLPEKINFAQCSITSYLGNTFWQKTFYEPDANPIRINVSNYPPGVYRLRVDTGNETYFKKFIISK
ncbi:MAG: T9SS type A sorting domain-containing protein [Bacteroidia bacterium]